MKNSPDADNTETIIMLLFCQRMYALVPNLLELVESDIVAMEITLELLPCQLKSRGAATTAYYISFLFQDVLHLG